MSGNAILMLLCLTAAASATDRGDVQECMDDSVDKLVASIFELTFKTQIRLTLGGRRHPAISHRRCLYSRPTVTRGGAASTELNRPLAATVNGRRFLTVAASAASEAQALLEEGKDLWRSGEKMEGLNKFEKALEQPEIPDEVRQELLYSCMAGFMSYGQIELSKMYLRDMVRAGLKYEEAIKKPGFVRVEAPIQVKKQILKAVRGKDKGSGVLNREAFARTRRENKQTGRTLGEALPPGLEDLDMEDQLDVTYAGIAKRLGIILVTAVIVGVAIFQYGLQFL